MTSDSGASRGRAVASRTAATGSSISKSELAVAATGDRSTKSSPRTAPSAGPSQAGTHARPTSRACPRSSGRHAETLNRSFMFALSPAARVSSADPCCSGLRGPDMLTATQCDQAARHLLAARRAGQPALRLAEACRPTDVADALAIQRRVQELLGVQTGGWKCSVPTAGRSIACAAIFATTIARASPWRVIDRGGQARIEPEVAFVLGRDLPSRATPYAEPEVRAAIAET